MAAAEMPGVEESVICVSEAVNIHGRPDQPGNLYFFRAPGFKGEIPEQQESARRQIDNFVTVLRVALQTDDPPRFRQFFERALTLAQAVFDPVAFNKHALNDLPDVKNEIVQVAGSRIKASYTKRLARSVAVAIVGIIILCYFAAPHVVDLAKQNEKIEFSLWNTGLLLCSSFFGLLFASMTRSIEPTFEKLLTPDADLMEPWFRLLFYGIAIVALSLLFQTKMVTLSFGDKVSTGDISSNWLVAIAIGLFLGIAERALPNEVLQWSRKFLPSSQETSAK